MPDSFQPCGLQHTRLICPRLFPRVCSDSCLLSQWCYLTISSSAAPFSCFHQSFPKDSGKPESFPTSWHFTSGGQSIRASASVCPMNIKDWFPLGLTGLISLLPKGLLKLFSKPQFKSISSSALSLLYGPTLTTAHDYWKNHSFFFPTALTFIHSCCHLKCHLLDLNVH